MRVLIVEDHPLVREVLASVVRETFAEPAIDMAGSCAEGVERARAGGTLDMVLLDLGLPDCSGIDTLKRFRRARSAAAVAVLSESEDPALAVAAMENGARAFLSKKLTRQVISAILLLVAAGGTYVPPQAIEARRNGQARRLRGELTARQLDVLRLIGRGLANREIAERLRIAEDTVKQHARGAYAVLGVASRTQAVTAATRRGIRFD